MPISEYREVRFDAPALRAALQARLSEANAALRTAPAGGASPPSSPLTGTVVAATVSRPDPVQLTVEIASPEGAQRGTVVMEAVEVAAALIRACMQRGIRLPRTGAKTLKAIPGGVALVVSISHADGGAATAGPPGSPRAA